MYSNNMLFWVCVVAWTVLFLVVLYDMIVTFCQLRKLRKARDRPLVKGKAWGQRPDVPYGLREDANLTELDGTGCPASTENLGVVHLKGDPLPFLVMDPLDALPKNYSGRHTYPKIDIDIREEHAWHAKLVRAITWSNGEIYRVETKVDGLEELRDPKAISRAEERLKDMLHAYLGKKQHLHDRHIETRSEFIDEHGYEYERRTVATVETYLIPLNRKKA